MTENECILAIISAAPLQTLAEKCLIPIYKLPKFAAELPDTWHDIYIYFIFYLI